MTNLKKKGLYFLNSLKNTFKILLSNKVDNLYLPNFLIRNVIYINPKKIKYINGIPFKFFNNTRLFMNFDWDKKNKTIKKQEIKDYKFIICKDFYDKTKKKNDYSFLYQKKNLAKYKKIYNREKKITLKNYLENKFKLFQSIKKNGLKNILNNDIQFKIDRNFNLVKVNSGDHRFFISRILKLKKIPIEIKLIHADCFKKDINNEKLLSNVNKLIRSLENRYN